MEFPENDLVIAQRCKRFCCFWIATIIIVLVGLMAAIVTLQVVYYTKDDPQHIQPSQHKNVSADHNTTDLSNETISNVRDVTTSAATFRTNDITRIAVESAESQGHALTPSNLDSGRAHRMGAGGFFALANPQEGSTSTTTKATATPSVKSVATSTSTRTTFSVSKTALSVSKTSTTQTTTQSSVQLALDKIRNKQKIQDILVALILTLFGIGVICIICTVMMVKGVFKKERCRVCIACFECGLRQSSDESVISDTSQSENVNSSQPVSESQNGNESDGNRQNQTAETSFTFHFNGLPSYSEAISSQQPDNLSTIPVPPVTAQDGTLYTQVPHLHRSTSSLPSYEEACKTAENPKSTFYTYSLPSPRVRTSSAYVFPEQLVPTPERGRENVSQRNATNRGSGLDRSEPEIPSADSNTTTHPTSENSDNSESHGVNQSRNSEENNHTSTQNQETIEILNDENQEGQNNDNPS